MTTERAFPKVQVYNIAPDRHRWARGVLERAAKARGLVPSRAELQGWAAVALVETQYGSGWKGAMAGSNNWGAVQAKPGQPSAPWQDQHPDGTVYSQPFRVYSTPEEGAADLIRHLTALRPMTWAAMRAGDWWQAGDAMRQESYFGGWCPKAAAKFGGQAVRGLSKGPVDSWPEAQRACHLEAFPVYSAKLRAYSKQVADALGEEAVDNDASKGGALVPLLLVGAAAAGWWYYRKAKR
jgi:hypothetical protein